MISSFFFTKCGAKRLASQRPELVQTKAVPMERLRAEVSKEELQTYYDQVSDWVVGVDPRMVINVDEVGFFRKHSMRSVACVVPAYAEGTRIEYIPQSALDLYDDGSYHVGW